MSEEEKVLPETEEVETQVETQDEQSNDDTSKEVKSEDSTQLEAALKREREAREKAEKAAADKAFKLREERRRQKEDSEEVDEDKPVTAKDIQRILAEEREATQKVIQESETKKIASELADNPTEQALILEIYKNRSFPAHLSLQEKLEEAKLIANKDKIFGENKELKRALLGKKTVSKDSATTQHDEPVGSKPKLAPIDAQVYQEAGFTWNDKQRRWQKKLPNGQFLIKEKGKPNRVVSA